jgi:hypothetical protein
MPSASITGMPNRSATTSGIIELTPPASIGMVANAFCPNRSSSRRSEAAASVPRGNFSTMQVGAPIIAVGMISASSGTSCKSISSRSRPVSRIADSTISRPT